MALLKNMSSAIRVLSVRLQPLLINAESNTRLLLQSSLQCKCSRFSQPAQLAGFHTSIRRQDLSEFLDERKHWAEEKVKVGRPWKKDELRIKGNDDLHKLWYVLLKERNVLLTMEAEYKRLCTLLPSPERIDKVEESMENLLSVVKERNEAYNLLETGTTGAPRGGYVRNFFGLKGFKKFREHPWPKEFNPTYRLLHPPYRSSMGKYIMLYKEKMRREEMKKLRRERLQRKRMLKAFPHLGKN
ncbi:large ribosomal subunit protein uL29m-like [Haliotis cracherodii]|uniref:large ribosomal subunit protein uL29m-like n=1 Tax=Haliotis cracherodii TaxID=6455 RepID=UPI0039E97561